MAASLLRSGCAVVQGGSAATEAGPAGCGSRRSRPPPARRRAARRPRRASTRGGPQDGHDMIQPLVELLWRLYDGAKGLVMIVVLWQRRTWTKRFTADWTRHAIS
jgi:hypothetical protein